MSIEENQSSRPDLHDKRINRALERYWRDNLKIMAGLIEPVRQQYTAAE